MIEKASTPGFTSRLVAAIWIVVLLLSCASSGAQPSIEALSLDPPDARPVFAIDISDADEAALLAQRLDIQILRLEGARLYFTAEHETLEALASLGYHPEEQNPLAVYRRVVRLFPREGESAIDDELTGALRLDLINREAEYWIVVGSLQQLRATRELGFGLAQVSANEPRPRAVRIVAPNEAAIREIVDPDLDVHGVAPRGASPDDGFLIDASAFDYQIDSLRRRGFEVQILEEP